MFFCFFVGGGQMGGGGVKLLGFGLFCFVGGGGQIAWFCFVCLFVCLFACLFVCFFGGGFKLLFPKRNRKEAPKE